MTVLAINGIGRIGKNVLKFLLKANMNVRLINDSIGDTDIHRHLLEFDSVHGRWKANFANNKESISINNKKLIFSNFKKLKIYIWITLTLF